jgi:hypothetical protein
MQTIIPVNIVHGVSARESWQAWELTWDTSGLGVEAA